MNMIGKFAFSLNILLSINSTIFKADNFETVRELFNRTDLQSITNCIYCYDPGEVLVHSAAPEYYRNITAEIYKRAPNYDIGVWWKNLIQSVDTKLLDSTGNSLSPQFIDFTYSTAAYLNPTQLVNTAWVRFIADRMKQKNKVLYVSTMHPFYQNAREKMLTSNGFNVQPEQVIQCFSKAESILAHMQANNNSGKEIVLDNVMIVAVDNDIEELKKIEKHFPSHLLIHYTEGQEKQSDFFNNLVQSLKEANPKITDEEISKIFMEKMADFWKPIVLQASTNYLKHLSETTSTNTN